MTSCKVEILGDRGVGKTTLINQLCYDRFLECHTPTIQDSYLKQFHVGESVYMLEMLETGHEFNDQWIHTGDCVVFVYSVTSRESFLEISKLYDQMQFAKSACSYNPTETDLSDSLSSVSLPVSVPILLLGNKSDKRKDRVVSVEEGRNLAREIGCGFFETSAKTMTNVVKAFSGVVDSCRQEQCQRAIKEMRIGSFSPARGQERGLSWKAWLLPGRIMKGGDREYRLRKFCSSR